ncbi:hypothetical protein R1flu_022598 [Riccia fluitans]|uniref:Uncharacterized protein n=1 Tax=Riccia fluitans TaxID=41844 RepID=A0ABD1XSJ4_9MARC
MDCGWSLELTHAINLPSSSDHKVMRCPCHPCAVHATLASSVLVADEKRHALTLLNRVLSWSHQHSSALSPATKFHLDVCDWDQDREARWRLISRRANTVGPPSIRPQPGREVGLRGASAACEIHRLLTWASESVQNRDLLCRVPKVDLRLSGQRIPTLDPSPPTTQVDPVAPCGLYVDPLT